MLENWRLLQELAGVLEKGTKQKESPRKSDNGHAKSLRIGDRIRYKDSSGWVDGIVESLDPACLALVDDTEIRVTADVLKQAVAAGIVRSA